MAYAIPTKHILTPVQLSAFQTSETHESIVKYVQTLSDSVVGVKLSDPCDTSPAVNALVNVLDSVREIARANPPVDNAGSRFGNPAFRTFYDAVLAAAPELHAKIPSLPSDATQELCGYFAEAWGSRARIDYGSGMELNFLCWLICLEKLGVLTPSDHKPLVTRVFWSYISVMRVLQSSYWLEPAGSHGVWGLDDYHFLPFLFGAAQLRGHKYIRPRAIHDAEIVEECSKDYMYFACIQFINSIKTASLRWHSPMLDDISAVKTWDKVTSGLHKMYAAEVLGKLPVMQHFLFGSILPYTGPPPEHSHAHTDGHEGHAHPAARNVHPKVTNGLPVPGAEGDKGAAGQQAGWGDCCGIPVPSAFGAADAAQGGRPGAILNGPGIRPVPFD